VRWNHEAGVLLGGGECQYRKNEDGEHGSKPVYRYIHFHIYIFPPNELHLIKADSSPLLFNIPLSQLTKKFAIPTMVIQVYITVPISHQGVNWVV